MNRANYALLVLFAINLMNFFDRQILGGVGEGIRREWGLSDTALGLLGTAFTLLYAVFGVPLGRLADRKDRRRLLAGGVFVWSVLTAVAGHGSQLPAADRCSPLYRRRRSDLRARVDARSSAISSRPAGVPAPWRSGCSACRSGSVSPTSPVAGCFRTGAGEARSTWRLFPGCWVRPRRWGFAAAARHGRGSRGRERRRSGNPYRLVLSIPTMWW